MSPLQGAGAAGAGGGTKDLPFRPHRKHVPLAGEMSRKPNEGGDETKGWHKACAYSNRIPLPMPAAFDGVPMAPISAPMALERSVIVGWASEPSPSDETLNCAAM